jgi:hypothetical protein
MLIHIRSGYIWLDLNRSYCVALLQVILCCQLHHVMSGFFMLV